MAESNHPPNVGGNASVQQPNSGFSLFSTASGRPVKLSEKSLKNAESLRELSDSYHSMCFPSFGVEFGLLAMMLSPLRCQSS
jgi:hypothetical protein